MKRWELLLAGLLLCSFPVSAYNVFAPNSFEDVQPDSYAYQTLRDMCGQGKSPGYSASFFDSGRKISRYELAGVLQSALKEGKDLSSKDKEALQRLKKEYARELEARGYKEDKPRQDPVLEIHGDARLREIKGEGADARLRTQVTWHLSGNTSVQRQETVE